MMFYRKPRLQHLMSTKLYPILLEYPQTDCDYPLSLVDGRADAPFLLPEYSDRAP